MEQTINIELSKIDNFTNHPFQVNEDESLRILAESIEKNGLLNPLIVRKTNNDRYELISGHRRKAALKMLGINSCNVIVKELSDDEATIYMVDSNIYREKILPSEKAFAYKMKMDAIKHQGKKTSGSGVRKLEDSDRNVRRYIRLTYLIPELLELVDNTVKNEHQIFLTMGIKPATEISYLTKDEQQLLYSTIQYMDITPSHAQTIQIRKLSKEKKLNFNVLEKIMDQKKGNQNEQISFNKEKIINALPNEYLKRDKRYIEQYIIEAIKYYKNITLTEKETINLDKLK